LELILIPVAPGELLDKITILRIKVLRIEDLGKRANAVAELTMLEEVQAKDVLASDQLTSLEIDLSVVNEALWEIEDAVRDHERVQDFGPAFVKLARDVYRQNDRRAALKRQINTLLGSVIVEEKSYASY
jgi:chaperonin cofactor prefoldin